jgi:hypothetical protein
MSGPSMKNAKSRKYMRIAGWTTIALGVLGIALHLASGRKVIGAAPGLVVIALGISVLSQSKEPKSD